jgi:hypothetical protein
MRILVIPDTQVKPGVPIDHLLWAGRYAVDRKPDAIVFIGDHWDMPSLSSYDKGKKSFEGRRYINDIAAGREAMALFMAPVLEEQERLRRNKEKQWKPRLVFTLGNHEGRIHRAVEDDSKLEGMLGYEDLGLEQWGFEVYPFLDVVTIEGVAFSHYFASGAMGRPVTSARALLTKKHMSCIMGHVQDRDIAYGKRADGTSMTGIFAGIFYQHSEDYLGNQGNESWRGVWMLNDVRNGAFDEMPISMSYLKRKYGGL